MGWICLIKKEVMFTCEYLDNSPLYLECIHKTVISRYPDLSEKDRIQDILLNYHGFYN